jgi:tRNA pseudouridine55 synthase
MSGILNVNKPAGPTSFDIVSTIRRGTGEKRVGHGGTLDPMASGVLVVLLGQASRVSEYLLDLPKTYLARLRLGEATTTYDAEGEVTSRDETPVAHEQLEGLLPAYVGQVMQVPPVFSALKVDGQRAYARARRGDEVTLPPRPVRIYRIEIKAFEYPEAEIEVECGRGTYIRSLAHDLGEALGCGAHLSGLVRTRVGPFWIERAVEIADLERRLEDGSWQELLDPVDVALLTLPQVTASIEEERDLRHGQAVTLDDAGYALAHPADGTEVRGYAEDGSFIGILRFETVTKMWKPRKIFAPEAGRNIR